MNPREYEKGIQDLKDFQLSSAEKSVLLRKIMEGPRPSPYVQVAWFVVVSHRQMARGLAAFLILFLAGSSTMYAAQEALPGNPLYAVKVGINELIVGSLARSPEARARWESTLAARRLHEAELLAARAELDTARRTEIEERFNRHASAFTSILDGLTVSSTGNIAEDLQTEFDALMSAHARILERMHTIGTDKGDGDEVEALHRAIEKKMLPPVPSSSQSLYIISTTTVSAEARAAEFARRAEPVQRAIADITAKMEFDPGYYEGAAKAATALEELKAAFFLMLGSGVATEQASTTGNVKSN